MIHSKYVIEAVDWLRKNWEADAEKIIEATANIIPYDGTLGEFVKYECVTMGGNWGGMLLSGIKTVFPEVWDAIPDDMGINPFAGIMYTLILCGVDTTV